jgi:hypothetical protein
MSGMVGFLVSSFGSLGKPDEEEEEVLCRLGRNSDR